MRKCFLLIRNIRIIMSWGSFVLSARLSRLMQIGSLSDLSDSVNLLNLHWTNIEGWESQPAFGAWFCPRDHWSSIEQSILQAHVISTSKCLVGVLTLGGHMSVNWTCFPLCVWFLIAWLECQGLPKEVRILLWLSDRTRMRTETCESSHGSSVIVNDGGRTGGLVTKIRWRLHYPRFTWPRECGVAENHWSSTYHIVCHKK